MDDLKIGDVVKNKTPMAWPKGTLFMITEKYFDSTLDADVVLMLSLNRKIEIQWPVLFMNKWEKVEAKNGKLLYGTKD